MQNETQFTFDLTVTPDGSFSLYVQEPALLQGVGFLYSDGSYTVDANGMADTFLENAFTEKSPVRLLFNALREFLFTGTETLIARTDGTFMSQRTVNNMSVSAVPIRGGTDGARLSFMSLPCPNLPTGGGNYHSRFEYVSVDAMEKCVDMIIEIVK